jgi:hypothetical protein
LRCQKNLTPRPWTIRNERTDSSFFALAEKRRSVRSAGIEMQISKQSKGLSEVTQRQKQQANFPNALGSAEQ